MLDSVESLIPLCVDKIVLKLEPQALVDSIYPHRRRSRVRRVLNRLRAIRRLNSAQFDYYRISQDIYLIIPTEQRLTLFLISWPQDLPQWARLTLD